MIIQVRGLVSHEKIAQFPHIANVCPSDEPLPAVPGTARAQVWSDPEKAFQEARQSGKKVLVIFSGSDWCLPCIRLEKNILTDSSFLQFARERLVMVEADFPQRKKIPPPLKAQYESLADRFDPEGAFPKIVLLAADRSLVGILSYTGQSPAAFIEEVRKKL